MNRLGGATAIVAAVVSTIAMTGCSQHTIDRSAWQKAEADAGVTIADWSKWESAALKTCKEDDISTFIAVLLDEKMVPLRAIEIDYEQACPGRKDVFDKAVADNKAASANVKDACSTPANARTQKQQQLAEAMGCA